MPHKVKRIHLLILIVLLVLAQINLLNCDKSKSLSVKDKAYIASIKEWHHNRVESFKKNDGWLSLAGLFWLKPGQNTFGADRSNDIIFPKGKSPAFIGSFSLTGDQVNIKINSNVSVITAGKPVTEMELISDIDGEPTVMTHGSLSWYLIKRGDRYGIRLKDSKSDQFKAFRGIDCYDIDPDWRITARFEPYNPSKKLSVPNVLGDINEENCPGALIFNINDKTFRLDPIAEPGDDTFFVIFADETSGKETYGGGRFLIVEKPASDGTTVIDFNKAYNPPCVFTPFATCPLPPEQNRLNIKIKAGEKYSGEEH